MSKRKFENIDEVKDDLTVFAWQIGEDSREGKHIKIALDYINHLENKLVKKQEELDKLNS